MTIAKLDAISFAFRCAVTQELVQAPAVRDEWLSSVIAVVM